MLVLVAVLISVSFLQVPARADLIAPAITNVYFEKNSMPYNDTVDYSVDCYGYARHIPPVTRAPGSYTPELVFHYSASCPGYGCRIFQPYYLMYTHIDWCNLTGKTQNQEFTIGNFSKFPYTRCYPVRDRVARSFGGENEYYYATPEYSQCTNVEKNLNRVFSAEHLAFSSAPSPPGNYSSTLLIPGLAPFYDDEAFSRVHINRSDITMSPSQYIHYLESCDPVGDPACGGWTINGKPLKSMHENRPLAGNATHLADNPCDTFLVRADPSLIMPVTDPDPWHHACVYDCNYTMSICESRFAIPATAGSGLSVTDTIGGSHGVVTGPENRSPVEFLYCGILGLLGGRCT